MSTLVNEIDEVDRKYSFDLAILEIKKIKTPMPTIIRYPTII